MVIAGALATLFEWYDYAVYGYFAVIIGKLFFPNSDPSLEILAAFGVFATGFIMRPLGALLFGFIGDKFGRRRALALSVLMMAVPTTLLGLLPTYDHVGIAAPILLLLIRLVQGLAVGGNYGGSFVFAIEHAPRHKAAFAGSLVMIGVIVGILFGSAIATIFTQLLSTAQLESWGWRVPFCLGVVALFAGIYIKEHAEETPDFQDMQESDTPQDRFPLTTLLKEDKLKLLQAIGFILFDVVGIYILFFFMATFLTTYTSISLASAMQMNTINLLCMVVFIPLWGKIADKFGYRKIMFGISAAFLLLSYPAFVVFSGGNIFLCWLMQFLFAGVMAAVYGVLPIAIVELFPVNIRYSASALVCNIGAAFFGGTAPWLSTWLIYKTGLTTAPAFYLMAISIAGFFAIRAMRFGK